MKKMVILILVASAVVGAAYWQWPTENDEQNLTLYGNVDIREVQLGFRVSGFPGFRVSGRLAQMHFEEGDQVAAGDEMATLDAQPFRQGVALANARVAEAEARLLKLRTGSRMQEIQQAQARVDEAEAALENVEREYTRQIELTAKKLSSQSLLDTAIARRDQAAARLEANREALKLALEGSRTEDIAAGEAALAAARVQLSQAQTQLDDTLLRAPSNGIILTRVREPGAIVASGLPVYSVFATWLAGEGLAPPPRISLEQRFWFNPELQSRAMLIPGSIAVVMTMIGTLLTALVVSREWECGSMEAIMSTPSRINEIVLSKILPYFLLGGLAIAGCTFLAVVVIGIPLQGSFGAIILLSVAFLFPALGQGLMISTLAKNQFVASQTAVMTGFLPAFLLSGFLFEIQSMPWVIQQLTYVIPARYYVSSLQTAFLAGDVWTLYLLDMAKMVAVGFVFFGITRLNLRERLD
ncbi:MAG: ABC transporter permease subunit [Halieaceae bacterium]|nr:ABC transporter permease subunit [Halieaceae bacterium]